MSARDLAAFAADIARHNEGVKRARLAYRLETAPRPCNQCGTTITDQRASYCADCCDLRAERRAAKKAAKEKP